MRHVRIYQPAKTATQSGRSKTKIWLLEYELETKRRPEPLMGWVASGDTLNEVTMAFDSKEEAIAFAEKKGWFYDLAEPHKRVVQGRSYLDNFKYTSPQPKQATE